MTGLGYDLVEIERSAGGLLRVTIDLPWEQPAADAPQPLIEQFVTVEDCEKVTRQLQFALEVDGADYKRLEVSSPGIDRPLFTAAQFARFTGESAKVVLKLPQDGRRRLQGQILRVEGTGIVFDVDGSEFAVDAANVEKARLVPDWAALGLAPAVDSKSGRDVRPGKSKKAAGKKPAAKNTKNPTNNGAASKSPDVE